MAASRLFQFRYSYERDLVDVYARISIGAAGAPTLVSGKGVLSVTRDSAGQYTIKLKDNFNRMLMVDTRIQNATGIPTSTAIGIKTDNSSAATAPSVTIVASAGGIAADPASGDILLVDLTFRNAST